MNHTGPNTQFGGLKGGLSSAAYHAPGSVWLPISAPTATTTATKAASSKSLRGLRKSVCVCVCVLIHLERMQAPVGSLPNALCVAVALEIERIDRPFLVHDAIAYQHCCFLRRPIDLHTIE